MVMTFEIVLTEIEIKKKIYFLSWKIKIFYWNSSNGRPKVHELSFFFTRLFDLLARQKHVFVDSLSAMGLSASTLKNHNFFQRE